MGLQFATVGASSCLHARRGCHRHNIAIFRLSCLPACLPAYPFVSPLPACLPRCVPPACLQVSVVTFDKTGTLTKGTFQVMSCEVGG